MSCGGGNSTSLPDLTIDVRDKVVKDVTLNITVKGIEEYSGQHSKIWLSSPSIGVNEDETWKNDVMKQDETNLNLWSYTFKDFELLDDIQYRLYYGSESAPKWRQGLAVMDSDQEYFRIPTKTSKTTYDSSATFVAPDGTLLVKLILDPIVYNDNREVVSLDDSVKVWAWNDVNDEPTMFEKETIDEKEVYAHEFTINTFNGVGDIEFTPVLGSSTQISYEKYQHGRFNAGEWKTLGSQISGKLSETTKVSYYQPLFNGQPTISNLDTKLVINPKIYNEHKDVVALEDTTYVYAWHNATLDTPEGTSKLTKNEETGYFESPSFNVETLDDVAVMNFTPTLGTASEVAWYYKHGEFEGNTFVKSDSIELSCTKDEPTYNYEAHFLGQPVEEEIEVSFVVNASVKTYDEETSSWLDVALLETSYVHAWLSCVSGTHQMFTKQEDGSFIYKINTTTWTKEFTFQYTLILNHNPFDTSDGEWGWKYKSGTIDSEGNFVKDEGTERSYATVTLSEPTFTFEALFNGQPS